MEITKVGKKVVVEVAVVVTELGVAEHQDKVMMVEMGITSQARQVVAVVEVLAG